MKKHMRAIAVFLVLPAAAAFGGEFSLSAGGGGLAGGFFTRYTLAADGTVDGNRIKVDAGQTVNQFNYGFFAFVDATYGTFSVSCQNGANTYTESYKVLGVDEMPPAAGRGWETVLGFSLLGKYPFRLNKRLAVFPLLGVEYQAAIIQTRTQPDGYVYSRDDGLRERDKDGNAYLLQDWNSLWVNLGGGADYMLAGNFFIRGELLYGFRLMTFYETKNLEMMKSMAGDPSPKLGGLTSGPSARLSAGWKFLGKL